MRLRILIGVHVILGALADEDGGSNRFILNLLAVGALVFGDGQQQRRTIGQFDGLLHRAFAESALAHNVAALGIFNRGGSDSAAP